MMEVPGYRILRELAPSGAFLLLRATREDDGASVLLKVPEPSRPAFAERLRHEFELACSPRLDGVLQALALVELPAGGPVLVLEGFGEQTLAQLLSRGRPEPRVACRIALGLVRAVEALHAAGILHPGLQPASVLLGADGESVKLTGCTPPTRPSGESPGPVERAPEAPPPGGFHCLGVTLHELLAVRRAEPLDAERACSAGDSEVAADGYDRAIRLARQHGLPLDEGVACEAAARFHLAEGRERAARSYLEQARSVYLRWGARDTAARLEREHSLLVPGTPARADEAAGASLEARYARLEDYSRTLERRVEEHAAELQHKSAQLAETLTRLEVLQQQLVEQEKLASLGSLTAGIAHELQNPLNFVNNFSELSSRLATELEGTLRGLADRLDARTLEDVLELLEDLRQNSQRIHTHGRRASDIIKTMLRHSRRSEGTRSRADFNLLIRDSLNLAVQGLRGKPGANNVRTESELDPHVGIIELVASDITRLLINMMDNAFYATVQKAQQAGAGFTPRIHVRTRRQGDTVELRVRDNGSGIPEHIREKLFHPFFTTKPAGVGTGLGLSLCHDIVQEHHGEIRVESEPGEYTEFIITLPAPRVASPGAAA